MPPALRKVVIFGVGLIGGSFARALAKAGAVEAGGLIGISRTATYRRNRAVLQRIVDRTAIQEELSDELDDADLVLLAVPVGQTATVLRLIKPHLDKKTVITDAGSTKGDVVAAAREVLGDRVAQFVPGHPIAGAELSGATAASADLYLGKKVVLTPLPENSGEAVARVRRAWELCGATVSELTPEQHDTVFAAVSHLPHLLSFALVHDLAQRDNKDLLLSFAASGFRDFTRIAASSPEMWRDISLANRDALLQEVKRYADELYVIHQALQNNDAAKLEEIFSVARAVRSNWTQQ
ncbi:MAG: hypothetical protein Fur0026_05930 [Sideroxydans sp.]